MIILNKKNVFFFINSSSKSIEFVRFVDLVFFLFVIVHIDIRRRRNRKRMKNEKKIKICLFQIKLDGGNSS